MLNWAKNIFRRKPVNERSREKRFSTDAARTDRLNQAHWEDAKDEPINALLSRDLSTIRARARHEFVNNPLVKGVVKTYRDDFVGPAGPKLTVQSDDDDYNESLEQVWREWWASPDVNGVHSGVGVLNVSSDSVWTAGEYLWQIVNDLDAPTPIKVRIMMIHPRRLSTPYDVVGDNDVVMGIKRTRTGKPLIYYIEEGPTGEGLTRFSLEYARVEAENIIHGFEVLEVDQARGLPWLTSCLPVVAKLREFDEQVLEAAKMAAALGVLVFTRNSEIEARQVDETTEIEGGTMMTLPPGYEAMQINPQQPPAMYKEFRHERLRELGRPAGMPLLTVNLDARGHSWSSARLDRDVYHGGIRVAQGGANRTGLNRLLDIVAREAELARLISMRRPGLHVKYVWTWPVFSSIDPLKEANAATARMRNNTSTLADECAALGRDWEEVIEQRKREMERLKEAGLPMDIGPQPPQNRNGTTPTPSPSRPGFSIDRLDGVLKNA